MGAALLVIISVGITSWLFYAKTTEILVNEAINDIAKEMKSTGEILKARIRKEGEDVLFLAGTPPIQGLLRSNNNENFDAKGNSTYAEWKNRLEEIFVTMLGTKSAYLKIRLIDTKGYEIVVVKRDIKSNKIIIENILQNKIQREYVSETLKLPADSVYLSEINLNREYGKVSTPHKAVLRSATPVYDQKNGKLSGLLVVTADMDKILKDIQKDIHTKDKKAYITNDRGEYLLHPIEGKAYGFDVGKEFRIQDDIPEISTKYLAGNREKQDVLILSEDGSQYVVNITKLYFDSSRPERFIAVVITQLYREILQEQRKLLDGFIFVIIASALVAILLAVFFSYQLTKPIKKITRVMDDYIHDRETNAEMPINSDDEIGVLARNYQELMKRVDEAQQGLINMNKNLEARVIDRTKSLEHSERQYKGVLDNIADGLVTIDKVGIITSFNKAAIEIFGYQLREVIGRNISMLMPQPYKDEHDNYLAHYDKTGVQKVIGSGVVVEGLRKDGSTFPMELAVSEMLIDGRKIFTGVLRDITERIKLEKVKNDFVSTVSHELRTPLTSIKGSLGLVNAGALGEVSGKVKEMLLVAENNAQRLLLLINDILDVQKIEIGEMLFYFDEIEITSLIKQSINDIDAYGNGFGIKFEFSPALGEVYAYVDRDRITQVLVNLLSNAVKFSPRNSTVVINLFRQEKSLCISVADSGSGIPEEFQPMLYEKFTQFDASLTRAKGGTGLGLTICKAIIERHNGLLHYVTSETTGTVFTVEILEVVQSQQADSFVG